MIVHLHKARPIGRIYLIIFSKTYKSALPIITQSGKKCKCFSKKILRDGGKYGVVFGRKEMEHPEKPTFYARHLDFFDSVWYTFLG